MAREEALGGRDGFGHVALLVSFGTDPAYMNMCVHVCVPEMPVNKEVLYTYVRRALKTSETIYAKMNVMYCHITCTLFSKQAHNHLT